MSETPSGPPPRVVVEKAVAAVESARRQGPAAVADAAIIAFNLAFAAGDVPLAIRMLEEAEHSAHVAGNKARQCQALTWLARIARMQVRIERAEQLARRATRLADHGKIEPEIVRDAFTELGDVLLVRTLSSEADATFARALQTEGTTTPQACVLLDKRAQAARQAGNSDGALAFLREAEERSRASGEAGDARFARLCQANVCALEGRWAEARRLLDPLIEDARAAGDLKVVATVLELRARCKRELEGIGAALADAVEARKCSLNAVEPLAYIQATLLVADLYEAEGNRLRALEAILTGQATLGDLTGPELAREIFAATRESMRSRWSDYDAISDAYIRERQAHRPS